VRYLYQRHGQEYLFRGKRVLFPDIPGPDLPLGTDLSRAQQPGAIERIGDTRQGRLGAQQLYRLPYAAGRGRVFRAGAGQCGQPARWRGSLHAVPAGLDENAAAERSRPSRHAAVQPQRTGSRRHRRVPQVEFENQYQWLAAKQGGL
ncbi:Nitric-oxide reductase subunit C (EC 1.7.99.7), partial [Pseudomonas sp. FG-3G]